MRLDLTPELVATELGKCGVPRYMIESIVGYILDGDYVGDFLLGVLCNDFAEAVCRADECNQANIKSFGLALWNIVPRVAWGSAEKVDRWMKVAGLNGLKEVVADIVEPAVKLRGIEHALGVAKDSPVGRRIDERMGWTDATDWRRSAPR
jgi:hypothetical protein